MNTAMFTRYSIRTSLLFLLLLLQFCKTEKETAPSSEEVPEINMLTGGGSKTWLIQSIAINGNTQTLTTCEQAAEITFSKDLTGSNKFALSDCSADTGFTWHVEEGAVSLIANTSEPQSLEIVALDNNTFQYIISYGTTLIYAYTLKAK